jgi:hypothetical protein
MFPDVILMFETNLGRSDSSTVVRTARDNFEMKLKLSPKCGIEAKTD